MRPSEQATRVLARSTKSSVLPLDDGGIESLQRDSNPRSFVACWAYSAGRRKMITRDVPCSARREETVRPSDQTAMAGSEHPRRVTSRKARRDSNPQLSMLGWIDWARNVVGARVRESQARVCWKSGIRTRLVQMLTLMPLPAGLFSSCVWARLDWTREKGLRPSDQTTMDVLP